MNTILNITDLRKTFADPTGPVHAVAGINLTIERGEIVSLLGPNGAGKTTLIDMILGLTSPTSGVVEICGTSPATAISQGKLSALLQTGGLLDDMRVGEVLTYIASAYTHHEPIADILERTNLTRLSSRKVAKLSGGERQRLKFALALLPNPDLLILDEPTTAMDVTVRREFWDAMHAEARAGRTIIFATHYLDEAERFANRIVLMNKGKIIADGDTASIRALAGLRQIRATISHAEPQRIKSFTQQYGADVVGEHIFLATPDSDAAALALLQAGATELELVSPSLDDAFELIVSADIPAATPVALPTA
ncbi:MAG: ABC transporter ATP-binding protein [Actinomycetaceae bacterium]|nr:ABC transporter ATP-binding protein [Actinomycetaceae bacterium]